MDAQNPNKIITGLRPTLSARIPQNESEIKVPIKNRVGDRILSACLSQISSNWQDNKILN